MRGVVLLVLVALAAYRGTRLVTLDTLFETQREWVLQRHPVLTSKIGQLITCPWCVGWWVTGAVVAAVAAWKSLPLPLLVWPAAATLVGLIGELDSKLSE